MCLLLGMSRLFVIIDCVGKCSLPAATTLSSGFDTAIEIGYTGCAQNTDDRTLRRAIKLFTFLFSLANEMVSICSKLKARCLHPNEEDICTCQWL
jgi:hypothetical protein